MNTNIAFDSFTRKSPIESWDDVATCLRFAKLLREEHLPDVKKHDNFTDWVTALNRTFKELDYSNNPGYRFKPEQKLISRSIEFYMLINYGRYLAAFADSIQNKMPVEVKAEQVGALSKLEDLLIHQSGMGADIRIVTLAFEEIEDYSIAEIADEYGLRIYRIEQALSEVSL